MEYGGHGINYDFVFSHHSITFSIRAYTEKEDGAKILIVQGLRFPTSVSSAENGDGSAMFTGNLMVELFAGKLLPYTGIFSSFTDVSFHKGEKKLAEIGE